MCIRDSAKEHGIHRTNLVITYVVFEVVQFKLSHQLDHQGNWAPCCPEWQHSPSGVGCQVFPRGGQLLPPPIAPCALPGHFPASSLPSLLEFVKVGNLTFSHHFWKRQSEPVNPRRIPEAKFGHRGHRVFFSTPMKQ